MRHVRLNVVVHESDFHLRRSFAVRGAAQTRRPASRAAGGGKWWHCQDGASNGCRRTSHATAAPFPPGARLCTCGRGNLYTQVAATANVNARGCSLLAASGTWGCSLAHMGLQPRTHGAAAGPDGSAPVTAAPRHASGSTSASPTGKGCTPNWALLSTAPRRAPRERLCTRERAVEAVPLHSHAVFYMRRTVYHAVVCMRCACGVHAVCMRCACSARPRAACSPYSISYSMTVQHKLQHDGRRTVRRG